jgi:ubiquinone biosynthesis protein UbiJ
MTQAQQEQAFANLQQGIPIPAELIVSGVQVIIDLIARLIAEAGPTKAQRIAALETANKQWAEVIKAMQRDVDMLAERVAKLEAK